MAHNPADHVNDSNVFHFFGNTHIALPSFNIFGYHFQVTKYMVLELLAAVLVAVIFIPLCRRAAKGSLPKGPFWNGFEGLLTFIRDDVAKPNLGDHDADEYLPFLWTMFIFILFMNLLGMIPFMGSPTANYCVTGGLAVCALIFMHGAPAMKHGVFHYLHSTWPHIEIGENFVAKAFGWFLSLVIWVIEMAGTLIKAFVLAVRLFANMFAGHMVLASILLFIVVVGETGLNATWGVVTFSSVVGVVLLSLLELFVAFLQAYVFVFLTSLFMGMLLHPEH